MRISTNFALPLHRLTRSVVAVLWLSTLALAGVLWGLLADTTRLRSEQPVLAARVAHLGTQEPTVFPRLPRATELASIRARVARINSVTETRGVSTLVVLAKLESLLPPDVWLSRLHHRARRGEVLLVADATNSDRLTHFLDALTRDPLFSQVLLTHEQRPEGASGVEFEIRLKVRT